MSVSKVYNGASFVTAVIKVWNGAAWEDTPKYFDGLNWVPLFPSVADVITLSGTTGSPNATTTIKAATTATAGWYVNMDGTVDKQGTAGTSQFSAGTEWCNQSPPANNYWVRATAYSGTTPTGTFGTWLALSTLDRAWEWVQTSIGTKTGIIKLEIAEDAAGASIVATGYYQGTATYEA